MIRPFFAKAEIFRPPLKSSEARTCLTSLDFVYFISYEPELREEGEGLSQEADVKRQAPAHSGKEQHLPEVDFINLFFLSSLTA